MRKWLILVLAVLLVFPRAARAQNNITLETVTVRLWPEYDQPSMLVIYDFTVPDNMPLPVTVSIPVPPDGNITAVAYQADNGLMNTEFAGPTEKNGWQAVDIFVKEHTTYHLEYYQTVVRTESKRSFKYKWPGTYPVNNFRVEIQVPEDSTSVRSNPMLPFVLSKPFLSGNVAIGNLEAGETYELNLHYVRTSEDTVMPSTQVTASEPITQNTAGRVTLERLPYILGSVGLLLILGAGYYFWQTQSAEISKPRKRNRNREETELTSIHCHECGTRAYDDDRFCRVCGTKLRTG